MKAAKAQKTEMDVSDLFRRIADADLEAGFTYKGRKVLGLRRDADTGFLTYDPDWAHTRQCFSAYAGKLQEAFYDANAAVTTPVFAKAVLRDLILQVEGGMERLPPAHPYRRMALEKAAAIAGESWGGGPVC